VLSITAPGRWRNHNNSKKENDCAEQKDRAPKSTGRKRGRAAGYDPGSPDRLHAV